MVPQASQQPVRLSRQSPRYRSRHPSAPALAKITKSLKRRDGLLNPSINRHPGLLRVWVSNTQNKSTHVYSSTNSAQKNANQSPLLRLPAELRDKIWRLALGDHQIDIQRLKQSEPIDSGYDIRTIYPDVLVPTGFVRPTFQLPRVCRQIYVEAASYIYTENTFAFHDIASFDKWIKNRCLGQRRLIASLDVPRTYTRLYRSGLRKSFRQKFPNIQRVGIDNWTLFCDYDQIRRLPESKGRQAVDMWAEAKFKIVRDIKSKEGQDMIVEWHGRSA